MDIVSDLIEIIRNPIYLEYKIFKNGFFAINDPIDELDFLKIQDCLPFEMPDLIRMIYTKVCNGQIGPGEGLTESLGADYMSSKLNLFTDENGKYHRFPNFNHDPSSELLTRRDEFLYMPFGYLHLMDGYEQYSGTDIGVNCIMDLNPVIILDPFYYSNDEQYPRFEYDLIGRMGNSRVMSNSLESWIANWIEDINKEILFFNEMGFFSEYYTDMDEV